VFFGDSITAGVGATSEANRYANQVATSRGWTTWENAGVGGTLLQNTVQNTISTIGGPTDGNGRDTVLDRVPCADYIFILYGTNDVVLNDVSITAGKYQNDLSEVVDLLVNLGGISPQNIVIGSPPYQDGTLASPLDGYTQAKLESYVAAAAAVASAKGTKYADIYQAMVDNGGSSLMNGNVHPNNAGHQVIANAFLAVL